MGKENLVCLPEGLVSYGGGKRFTEHGILRASAGDTGSYSVPAATHLISANAHETQKPLPYYGIDKRTTDYLTHI